jgi:hypothetical protein
MKNLLTAIVIAVAVSAGAAAQQPAPPPAAPAPPAPGSQPAPAPPAPAPAKAVPAVPAVPPLPGSDQPNIRFDIAITDDGAGAPAVRKNLVMMVQGNGKASLRSQGIAPAATDTPGQVNVFLNVDVSVAGWGASEPNKVRSRIMVEYQPYLTNVPVLPASVRAQVDVHLEQAKKVLIWQTADPISDRHSSIEVTATVLK